MPPRHCLWMCVVDAIQHTHMGKRNMQGIDTCTWCLHTHTYTALSMTSLNHMLHSTVHQTAHRQLCLVHREQDQVYNTKSICSNIKPPFHIIIIHYKISAFACIEKIFQLQEGMHALPGEECCIKCINDKQQFLIS